ncbi:MULTISPECIES: hypothetical protein [Parabacteroides]|uniref:hypothetical protein n=1 Tax=Parabacteroides leei TaxID=2939491 RepID=UPI00189BADC5|nr:hypothetical protein [Parabacteroides goldsteinii]
MKYVVLIPARGGVKRKNWMSRLVWGDGCPGFGLADNVRTFYLTGILPIPEIIAGKDNKWIRCHSGFGRRDEKKGNI